MSSEMLDIKTLSGGSTTKTVVMVIGAVLILAGIAFIMYIIFNNPAADALAGLFSFGVNFAKGVESAFATCFGGSGKWSANCLWMYLGALVVVAYGVAKIASLSGAGNSESVDKAAFETGKSADQLASEVLDNYNTNKDAIEKTIEDNNLTPDQAELFRQNIAGDYLTDQAVEAAKNAGGDYEAVSKEMATNNQKAYDKTIEDKNLSDEDVDQVDDAVKEYNEEA